MASWAVRDACREGGVPRGDRVLGSFSVLCYLACHGDAEQVVGVDDAVRVPAAGVDLCPVDGAGEGGWAGSSGVTGEAVVCSQVQGFVGAEDERHGGVDPFGPDVGSVEVEGGRAARAHSAAVASEFHPSVSASRAARRSRSALDCTDPTTPDPTTPDPVAPGGRSIPELPLSAAPQGRRRTVAPTQFIIEGVEGPEWWGISTVVSVWGVA